MKSSGKLDIISNDSIKINLLQLDQLYKKVIERNKTMKTSHDKYANDPIVEIINTINFIVIEDKFKEIHPKNYSTEEKIFHFNLIRNDILELFNNQKFMNYLVSYNYSYELILGEIQEAYSKALKLKQQIDSELKKEK